MADQIEDDFVLKPAPEAPVAVRLPESVRGPTPEAPATFEAPGTFLAGTEFEPKGPVTQYAVNHPTLGRLVYDAKKWNEKQIQDDINIKEMSAKRIEQGYPQFLATEAWLKAENPEDKLAALYDWAASNKAAMVGEGVKLAGMVIGARRGAGAQGFAQEAMGALQRAGIAAGAETLGEAIKGNKPTLGGAARAGIESVPMVRTTAGRPPEEIVAQILKFYGAGMAGETAKQAIEGKGFDTQKIQERGLGGLTGAIASHALDSGALAAKELAKLKMAKPLIETAEMANQNNILIDPNAFNPRVSLKTGRIASGGQSLMQQHMSQVNQDTIKSRLSQEFRLDDLVGSVQNRIKENGEVYEQVANLSPAAKAAEQEWKKQMGLWTDANTIAGTAEKAAARTQARADAQVALAEANAQFAILEKEAAATGNKGLTQDLKEARTKLGQLYAIKSATNPATGNINGAVLGEIYQSKPDYLTGFLGVVGRIGAANKEVVTDPKMLGERYKDLVFRTAATGAGTGLGYGIAAVSQGAIPMDKALTAGLFLGASAPPIGQRIMSSGPVQRMAGSLPINPNAADTAAVLARFAAPEAVENRPSNLTLQRFMQDMQGRR